MNRATLVAHLSIEVNRLELWLEQGWLVPAQTTAEFSPTDVARAHLIRDLQDRLGVNDPGVDLVLHLIDQLHGVRRALEDLRGELGSTTR